MVAIRVRLIIANEKVLATHPLTVAHRISVQARSRLSQRKAGGDHPAGPDHMVASLTEQATPSARIDAKLASLSDWRDETPK